MVAADAEKLSKELVERAAAGRHQDVDRLLKDGADPWLQQITPDNFRKSCSKRLEVWLI